MYKYSESTCYIFMYLVMLSDVLHKYDSFLERSYYGNRVLRDIIFRSKFPFSSLLLTSMTPFQSIDFSGMNLIKHIHFINLPTR